MKYSAKQASSLANQIKTRFGERIASACDETIVPESLVAGLIGVEAGKDGQGNLREEASRFESHVLLKLQRVRGRTLTSYNNIRYSHLKDAGDGALRALATSWGLCQIMGWWAIHLGCTVADLRHPDRHLRYAVQLLMRNAHKYIESGDHEAVFRIWNTGSPKGETHDPDYVHNATAVMTQYQTIAC